MTNQNQNDLFYTDIVSSVTCEGIVQIIHALYITLVLIQVIDSQYLLVIKESGRVLLLSLWRISAIKVRLHLLCCDHL